MKYTPLASAALCGSVLFCTNAFAISDVPVHYWMLIDGEHPFGLVQYGSGTDVHLGWFLLSIPLPAYIVLIFGIVIATAFVLGTSFALERKYHEKDAS